MSPIMVQIMKVLFGLRTTQSTDSTGGQLPGGKVYILVFFSSFCRFLHKVIFVSIP